MIRVEVSTVPEFRAGRPELLFEGAFASGSGAESVASYDVAADGQHFVMGQLDAVKSRSLHVVLNWFEELTQRIPVDP